MRIEDLTDEQVKLSREMVKFPLKFCNACFFGEPEDQNGKVNNGTMTLVKHNGEKYGITNFHVIEAYRQRRETESIDFYIGNLKIDIVNTLLDEDKELDLCTLYLDGYPEESFGSNGDVPTYFYEIGDFSCSEISQGDFVMFGGYPGVWRSRPERNHLIFDTLSSGSTEVTEVTPRNIRCELALHKCVVTLAQHQTEFPQNLGGLSGGPVFLNRLLPSGLSVFKLIGIIYEHMEEYDSILVRPISFINESFHIAR